MTTAEVPYITMADMRTVLADAAGRGLINTQQQSELCRDAEARVDMLLRKAQENKAVNMMRQECLDRLHDIQLTAKEALQARRLEIRTNYERDCSALNSSKDAARNRIHAEYNETRAEAFNREAVLRQELRTCLAESTRALELRALLDAQKVAHSNARARKNDNMARALDQFSKDLVELRENFKSATGSVNEVARSLREAMRKRRREILDADPKSLCFILESLKTEGGEQ